MYLRVWYVHVRALAYPEKQGMEKRDPDLCLFPGQRE
jgi:hypothetical protein